MEEKNWLKELVESSDFEYFDGEEDYEDYEGEDYEDYEGEDYEDYEGDEDYENAIGKIRKRRRRRMMKAQRANIKKPLGQGNKSVPLQASPNPFTQQQSYNAVSNLSFDLIVKTTVRPQNETPPGYPQDEKPQDEEQAVVSDGGEKTIVYPPDATYEVPILYPFANKQQGYEKTLTNYGLLLKGATVYYEEGSGFRLRGADHEIEINGMSFNLSDLYNAILYRNLKLQINKIRFALQEPDDVAYLNTLTMYAIGITSKIQKDSLNVGSFVQPQNFNTNIVDVDMKIILDYNSILTYQINTAMVNKPASGDAVNTFRMSFFCNILR